jgi:hypothetical protein
MPFISEAILTVANGPLPGRHDNAVLALGDEDDAYIETASAGLRSDGPVKDNSVCSDGENFLTFFCRQQLDYQPFLSRVGEIHGASVCRVAYPLA